MSKLVLITGGAGFIGQHLARALLKAGDRIRILDNFNSQIHGGASLPADLLEHVEVIKADIRERDVVRRAVEGVNCIVHLAAETGTGQSMYEIERYFSVNVQGTATLLDVIQNESLAEDLSSLVVASSRAIYGEGMYKCPIHGSTYPESRQRDQLEAGRFEPQCPVCRSALVLTPTNEAAPFRPMSMYGLTKQVQEQAVLMFARTRNINGFAMRYQNVYGPGQSLKNPYTGILAVFSNLARLNQRIKIYEDGHESRDFVYIDDVIEATFRALNYEGCFVGALNVGAGRATTVMTVAQHIIAFFQSESAVTVTGEFRLGDIRHNIADLSLVRKVLDFVPRVAFEEGLPKFLEWASGQAPEDQGAYLRSISELEDRGLMGKASDR